jgi:ABC-2 type transport system ATP-binding protein
MQRRLNLALGLVHDPEILVLDEPEAGLDPQSRVLVREYIRSLARVKTIILTTHNMDEADRMADRVAIIDHGTLLVLDTPEALKRTVGEGDVLEIKVEGISGKQALAAIEAAIPSLVSLRTPVRGEEISSIDGGDFFGASAPRNDRITMRGRGIVDQLPAIITGIQQAGGQVGDAHLRANTLEDVFISLTGRRLRE